MSPYILYWGLAMIIIVGINIVCAFVPRKAENVSYTVGISVIAGMVVGLVSMWVAWSYKVGIYGPTPLLLPIVVDTALACIIAYVTDANYRPLGGVIAVVYLLFGMCVGIGSCDMIRWQSQLDLAGKVHTTKDLDSAMQPADPAHIIQTSPDQARALASVALSKFKLANNAIPGSRYTIGDPTEQFVDGEAWYIFPVEFDGWLKWKQDRQVPGYLRVSAENPKEEAQAVQTNSHGDEIHIKYLNSACWEFNAKRYLREHGYMTAILQDWTFEADNDWNPYYTVSVVERTIGFGGLVTKGVVVLNLQTGEIKYLSKDDPKDLKEIRKWIDRVVPMDVVSHNAEKWGEYRNASWSYNFWHKDRSMQTSGGFYITYSPDGHCQWFTLYTSLNNKDHALTGFSVTDAETGKMHYYAATGVTEELADHQALSMWANMPNITCGGMTPYNLNGVLAYVIPMHLGAQFAGISIVSLENIKVSGHGPTFDEALEEFRESQGEAGARRTNPNGGMTPMLTISGIVGSVGMPMLQGARTVFSFTIVGTPKIFHVVYNPEAPKAPFLAVGRHVDVGFQDTKEAVISCARFDLPDIVLTDENPAQAHYDTAQAVSGAERTREAREEHRARLLESDRFRSVDPDSLEQFLQSRGKRK